MKNTLTAGAALLLSTSIATAGGLDRSGNAYSILFEDGNYAQLSISSATPEVSGDYDAALGGGSTDNMAEGYVSLGFGLKYNVAPDLDLALFINQPFGANADYTQGVYSGLAAEWKGTQVAAVAKYNAAPGISVYGGVRAVQNEAEITIPDALIRGGLAASGDIVGETIAATAPAGTLDYAAETDADLQFGYVVGAAYEMPEIALRVSLTYESGLTHDFKTTEEIAAIAPANGENDMEVEMPQSLALDFQSGVAANTLVFGSIRWSEWSVWEIRPVGYESFTNDRVTGLDNDVFTYRIGVGQRINEDISVFGRITYEEASGDEASRLAPTDGSTSIGFGGSYTIDDIEISGGIEYAMLGDATDGSNTSFEDNTAIGVGLNVGYSF